MREQSEAKIERAHRVTAMSWGWFVEKIMQTARNSFPDRFYASAHPKHLCWYCGRGRVVLIEWKKPGKPARKQQLLRHEELRRAGVEVYVIDNVAEANRVLGIPDEDDETL